MCALRFPWFILLVGFGPVCRRWGGGGDYWWFLWGLAVFVGLGDGSFLGVCVCVGGGGGGEGGVDWGLWALSKVESSVHVRASSSEVYPAGKLQ